MITRTPDTRRARSGSLGVLLAAFAVAASGCSIDVTDPASTRWQATLQSMPPAIEAGSVAVLSFSDFSETSAAMTGGEAGVSYAWNVRAGTCSEEGTVFAGEAVYPLLEPGSTGEAEGETTVAGTLQRGSDYAAWLYRLTETDDRIAVACGRLIEQTS